MVLTLNILELQVLYRSVYYWLTAYLHAHNLSFLYVKIGKVLSRFERENGLKMSLEGCR